MQCANQARSAFYRKRRISERGNLPNEEEPDQAFGAYDGAGARFLPCRLRRQDWR